MVFLVKKVNNQMSNYFTLVICVVCLFIFGIGN